jgi:hypothetical protein
MSDAWPDIHRDERGALPAWMAPLRYTGLPFRFKATDKERIKALEVQVSRLKACLHFNGIPIPGENAREIKDGEWRVVRADLLVLCDRIAELEQARRNETDDGR